MTVAYSILVVLFMAVTSRQSGGGLGAKYLPKNLTFIPEVLFAVPFGVTLSLCLSIYSPWVYIPLGCIAAAWSYVWMQSATAPGLHWGDGNYNSDRTSTLKPFVDFLNRYVKADPSTSQYCWLYMAVKGFLIGLPVGGLPLMVLWPLGYHIGYKLRGYISRDFLTEFLAGAGAGISILVLAMSQ